MQGANDYVRKGQAFQFRCPAALSVYNTLSLTYDSTIRLKVEGACQSFTDGVVVSFATDFSGRGSYYTLTISGYSKTDRNHGYDIRDNCLAAAQAAGLTVDASQSDIDIYPPGSHVGYDFSGRDSSADPSGKPSLETILLIGGLVVAAVIVATKL